MLLPSQPLSATVIGAAFRIHNALGRGYLEHVYRNALALELDKQRFRVRIEVPLTVHFDNTPVGMCAADLIVEDILVVETKAQESILPGHVAQLQAYLRCSELELGLVLNFGPFKVDVKRVVQTVVGKKSG